MWNAILGWLNTNKEILAMGGAVVGFLMWDMRKKRLEIQKLKLEINKLKDETRIYRPTPEEIDRILRETERIAIGNLGFSGAQDPLKEFGIALHRFLTHLAAYQRIPSALALVQKERLYASMHHQPDPYGADFKELRFPDPIRVLRLWKDVHSIAAHQLSQDTVERIDILLSRYKSSNGDQT
ncbi:MAG TPA: hypothetical protein VF088_05120 [Pyrinomonadaceae bacterium]